MKWLWNKFWNEHTPPCMSCGWNMKVWKDSIFHMEWKCVGILVDGGSFKMLMVSYIGGKINLKKMKKEA